MLEKWKKSADQNKTFDALLKDYLNHFIVSTMQNEVLIGRLNTEGFILLFKVNPSLFVT